MSASRQSSIRGILTALLIGSIGFTLFAGYQWIAQQANPSYQALPATALPPVPTVRPKPQPATPIPAEPPPPGSWREPFFTSPIYPDRPENRQPSLDQTLSGLIDQAQQQVDVAIYDFDLEIVAEAMANAAKRGVEVRMVTDSDTLESDNPEIRAAIRIVKRANIPIVDDQREAIMHHKFVVIDQEQVWTGSWNFTSGDTYRLNNNGVHLISRQLAQNYRTEFERMFIDRRFGSSKGDSGRTTRFQIDGVAVENYFAPPDRITERIAERISQAQTIVQFMAFSFTSDPIASAMLERAKAGVTVAGVFETTGSETQFSEYRKLRRAGLDVYQDGNPYAMHHKVIIIDGQTVIFGSFNFSNNAQENNDENLLIIDDPSLAWAFTQEFLKVYQQARAAR